jgi:membrane-associated protein
VTLAAPALLDAQHLVSTYGLIGILLIVFAETGLLLGFFLPGDSLLFLAGFAAAGNLGGLDQSIGLVCIAVTAAAILGAQLGHWIGWKAGPVLFDRPESRLFKRENVTRAEGVLERFGPAKAVVLARFVPVVRTFMNPVAGVLAMKPREFLVWNVLGGVLWGTGLTLLGYFLGNVQVIRDHLELFIVGLVALSFVPIGIELLRKKQH